MSKPDYILDIASLARHDPSPAPAQNSVTSQGQSESTSQTHRDRPWLAIQWRCCSVYSRVYRNRDATAYDARCPRCSRTIRIAVGEGGTDSRFFEAR